MRTPVRRISLLVPGLLLFVLPASAGEEAKPKPDFPPFAELSKGYEKVISTADGASPLWGVWKRAKDGQLLAELPKDHATERFTIVPTVAGGDTQMGVYSIWHYLVGQGARTHYWKRYDKKIALMEPNLEFRSSGDGQSRAATSRVYTDRVVLSTPILGTGPGGGPVIDLDAVLLKRADAFFGAFVRGADLSLSEVASIKAFPYNVEASFSFPRAGGQLTTIHYSIGAPPKSPGFEPRAADRRVGFYYEDHTDRAKNDGESQVIRHVNRWNLEKADPKLRMSPPKKPIVYHIEHTTPVRYRRWVKSGILAWNKAFELVGIVDAIEVRQQDEATGAYMDVDPEDIRHSFVRWTNAHMGFAIGPVHAHPETGEIYEADIVLDEQFISGWADTYRSAQLASAAMGTFDAETVAWLDEHPEWDPRVRLAPPAERGKVLAYRRALAAGTADPADAPPTMSPLVWAPVDARLAARGGWCQSLEQHAEGVALMRMARSAGLLEEADTEEADLVDGVPEEFIGPLLKAVVMHEVGHTMGLMHNWKGSSAYSYAEINSEAFCGERSLSSTVMDYLPTNLVVEEGELVQGDLDTIDLGPYDLWAIEWGYTTEDPAPIAKRSAEPGHAFMAEDGQAGPDPHAKIWDVGENSLDFADAEMRLVHHLRAKILDEVVADGESWQKARTAFGRLLGKQMMALNTAANWIGGAHVSRSFKGDPGAGEPVVPVALERQRRALEFVLENGFRDASFGLSPEILSKLASDNWYDEGFEATQDWPIHDQVLGVQAAAMTMLLNPTRLRRVEDNLARLGPVDDALTVPEILDAIRAEIWTELPAEGRAATDTRPLISGTRRNLQREHVDRLIALATGMSWPNASANTIATLARRELRALKGLVAEAVQAGGLDAYSEAHLADAHERIRRALEAPYVRND